MVIKEIGAFDNRELLHTRCTNCRKHTITEGKLLSLEKYAGVVWRRPVKLG